MKGMVTRGFLTCFSLLFSSFHSVAVFAREPRGGSPGSGLDAFSWQFRASAGVEVSSLGFHYQVDWSYFFRPYLGVELGMSNYRVFWDTPRLEAQFLHGIEKDVPPLFYHRINSF